MSQAAPGFLPALRSALAPSPSRMAASLRMTMACLLIVAISMTLQIPSPALAAYMVFFVSRDDMAATAKTGIALLLAVTLGIALTILACRLTVNQPALRLGLMTVLFLAGMFISRIFVLGALGFGLGFVLLITQSTVDVYPNGETLLRDTLWTWVSLAFSIVVVILANLFVLPARREESAAPAAAAKPPVFVADAFSNPVYMQFALKTTFAAMLCYVLYTGFNWPGIHTCVITCAVIALTTTSATMHKAALRLGGALAGGALALLATVFIVPHLESLGGLLLLLAPVAFASAWISSGAPRIAYFGWQMAFAFFLCTLHGFQPSDDVTVVRDRLVGIVLGTLVMALVFHNIWPEHDEG